VSSAGESCVRPAEAIQRRAIRRLRRSYDIQYIGKYDKCYYYTHYYIYIYIFVLYTYIYNIIHYYYYYLYVMTAHTRGEQFVVQENCDEKMFNILLY